MKNALAYYYNIETSEIHRINKSIKFKYLNKNYMLYPIHKSNQELIDLYRLQVYLQSIGVYCHRIIPNINKEIATRINKELYVLLEINMENRVINLNDIFYITNISLDIKNFQIIKRMDWKKLWSEKNDYVEYQISQIGNKYRFIRENSPYFIGIAENCISLLNTINNNNVKMSICHNRINEKTMTDFFYNPIEFIIDKRIRDFGEYIKSYSNKKVITNIIEKIYDKKIFNNEEIKMLFIRFLYPSNYFDIYEKIIRNRKEEKIFERMINEIDIYESNIKKIYNYIRSISNLPEIEWLEY